MRKNTFFAFFSQLAAIGAIASTGCGEGGGPSGLSSNPQDWPVPPCCGSRVCEAYARRANGCVGQIEGSERVGRPCSDEERGIEEGIYICRLTHDEEFSPGRQWQIRCADSNGMCTGDEDVGDFYTLPCHRVMELGETICDCFEQIGLEEIGLASPILHEDMDMDDCLLLFGLQNTVAHRCIEIAQKNTCEDLTMCFLCYGCIAPIGPLPAQLGTEVCPELELPDEICPGCACVVP